MNIRSSIVRKETFEYFTVHLSPEYTAEEFRRAQAELEVFSADYHGAIDASPVEFVQVGGQTSLRVALAYSAEGTDLNPLVYPDAVDIEDLLF